MSTELPPCQSTLVLENLKFSIDSTGRIVVSTIQTPTPFKDTLPLSLNFLDGGSSPDMNIDGSVTPVVFTAGPGVGEVIYLSGISIWLEDKGSWLKDSFGAIAGGLTNGVLIEIGRNAVFQDIGALTNNFDIASIFNGGQAISLKDISGEIALIGTQQTTPLRNLRLDGDNSDLIRITVRDDLTGLDNFSIKMKAWRDE